MPIPLRVALLVLALRAAPGPTFANAPQLARGADVLSVKDFGALGDGLTDDTLSIQAAATAAGLSGAELYFPSASREYKISRGVTLGSGVTVRGAKGVRIHQVTPGEASFRGKGLSGVTIRGMVLQGPGDTTAPTNTTDGQIALTSSEGVTIEGCTVYDSYNGITVDHSTGVVIRDNEVSRFRLYGILASVSNDFHVDNNRIHDSTQSGPLNSYGITASGGRTANPQQDNSIVANKIRNVPSWDGIMTHDCDGLLIAFNDIRGVRTGLDIGPNGPAKYVENVRIIGNLLEQTQTDAWSGKAAMNSGIVVVGVDAATRARNVTISGNVIKGFNAFNAGAQANGPITLINTEGVAVSGNRIYGAGTANRSGGIYVNGLADGLAITGNSILSGAGQAPVLIHRAKSDTLVIAGNALSGATDVPAAVRVDQSTIGTLGIFGNSTSGARYLMTASTIGTESVDWGSINHEGTFTVSGVANGTAVGLPRFRIPGAAVGDTVFASSGIPGILLSASATAAGMVEVRLVNFTGASLSVSAAPIRLIVYRR